MGSKTTDPAAMYHQIRRQAAARGWLEPHWCRRGRYWRGRVCSGASRGGLRRDPLVVHKATLASIVAEARPGIRFNERIEGFRKISVTGQKLCSNLKARSQLIS